ncbi:hypothetical protein T8J41_16205 [Nitratireductor rhodophyticola]|uniref:hypothetical protein n=1 Tax=Nitratireductor rhodophyticola TaxID=2854036 RepID=UPI002AC9E0D7|nr:hypothetical protein [Nitratireductor rhodophyticola]WPZ13673.1 hypothetical protein T8J41_16205 [Nitratireductor rhodophyticola]
MAGSMPVRASCRKRHANVDRSARDDASRYRFAADTPVPLNERKGACPSFNTLARLMGKQKEQRPNVLLTILAGACLAGVCGSLQTITFAGMAGHSLDRRNPKAQYAPVSARGF